MVLDKVLGIVFAEVPRGLKPRKWHSIMRHSLKAYATPLAVTRDGVRGRARFEVIPIYRDTRRAKGMESKLAGTRGISRVSANPRTGSLLVHFNQEEVTVRGI